MSNSASRFSFAPSVKSARGADMDTDREIRLFQDTSYRQCAECGRYVMGCDDRVDSCECFEFAEWRHNNDFMIVNKSTRNFEKGAGFSVKLIS